MKTNILTSRGLRLGIFSLALAIPALSAQAQKKQAAVSVASNENSKLVDAAKTAIDQTKIYPTLDEMQVGGIFTKTSKPSTSQIQSLLDLKKKILTARRNIQKQISQLDPGNRSIMPDTRALNELKQQEEELSKTIEDLDSRLSEFEKRGQNLYDQMSDEARKKFDENLNNKASTIDKLMGSKYDFEPGFEPGVDNTAPKVPELELRKEGKDKEINTEDFRRPGH